MSSAGGIGRQLARGAICMRRVPDFLIRLVSRTGRRASPSQAPQSRETRQPAREAAKEQERAGFGYRRRIRGPAFERNLGRCTEGKFEVRDLRGRGWHSIGIGEV